MTTFEFGGLEDGGSLTRSQIGSLIRTGFESGASGASILRGLRDVGLGIREGSFYELAGEVRSAMAQAESMASIPLDQTLTPENYAVWHGGAADTYLHRVSLLIRESEEGVLSVIRKNFDVLSDTPLSQAEAVLRATELFEENTGSQNYPTQELLGAVMRGAYHQVA